MSRRFGAVRQIGYVVKDIKSAMDHWLSLGVGPWFYNEHVTSTEFRYRGATSPLPKLSIALANSGPLQLELIQQRDDAPTLYRDSLARNGECAQHVAYWTLDQFDSWCEQLRADGYLEGHAGRMGAQRGRFAYFVRPDFPSAIVELSELTGGKGEYFEQIRNAAANWQGEDPIRRVGAARRD